MKLPVFLDNNQMLNVVRPVTGASIATLVETLTAVLATGEGSTKDSTFMEVSWSVYAASYCWRFCLQGCYVELMCQVFPGQLSTPRQSAKR